MVLKIAVRSSGIILADGESVDLVRLDEMLQAVKAAGGAVWYYREQTANPEAAGMSVIKLVVKHKLGVSISSKPDYSDYLDAKGISHPRTEPADAPATNGPRMPEVAPRED